MAGHDSRLENSVLDLLREISPTSDRTLAEGQRKAFLIAPCTGSFPSGHAVLWRTIGQVAESGVADPCTIRAASGLSPYSEWSSIAWGRWVRLIERVWSTCAADPANRRQTLVKTYEPAILGAAKPAT